MDELLAYLRNAIERPETVQPWPEWWAANVEAIRKAFDHADYLRLKFRRLDAARAILERLGCLPVELSPSDLLDRTHCPHCGEPLIKFLPGTELTQEEVVAFGHKSGIEECQRGYWLHPGVYCPTGCIQLMIEFEFPDLLPPPTGAALKRSEQ